MKEGFERIIQHIDELPGRLGLADSQKFWPRYLFHFTDINNAKCVLEDGYLYSRNLLLQECKLETDIASRDVIEKTPEKWKDFVRLYFRPRTPMQYRNEGIRSKEEMTMDAHCPVPVFFLFDAKKILSGENVSFSNGNLSVPYVKVDDTVDFYLSLPFEKIYHDSSLRPFSDAEKNFIKFHRHAEIIVKDRLELTYLKYIVCRSRAEFETLLFFLSKEKREKWKRKINVDTRSLLFYSQWCYIDKVFLTDAAIKIFFQKFPQISTMRARVELTDLSTKQSFRWEDEMFRPGEENALELTLPPKLHQPACYQLTFYLENNLVYQNSYSPDSGIMS